jgi:hypothetical protein
MLANAPPARDQEVAMEEFVVLANTHCDDRIQCPKIVQHGDDVIVTGYLLDNDTRSRLQLPDREDAIRLPREVALALFQDASSGLVERR